MLILSRKVDESIVIGGNIELRVTRIEGDIVKIGINAPREISVYRKELLDSIERSNREAMETARQSRGPKPVLNTKLIKQFAKQKQGGPAVASSATVPSSKDDNQS